MNRNLQPANPSVERGDVSPIALPPYSIGSDTGVMDDTAQSWQSCMEFSDIFFKCLEFGRIRGIVVISAESGPDDGVIALARELVRRDIMVAISDADDRGLMEFDLSDDANAGLSELCDFIGINPAIRMGSRTDHSAMLDFYAGQAGLASADIKDLPWAAIKADASEDSKTRDAYLGQISRTLFTMDADPVATADLLDDYIHEKRLKLEWCDRFHCSEDIYS